MLLLSLCPRRSTGSRRSSRLTGDAVLFHDMMRKYVDSDDEREVTEAGQREAGILDVEVLLGDEKANFLPSERVSIPLRVLVPIAKVILSCFLAQYNFLVRLLSRQHAG